MGRSRNSGRGRPRRGRGGRSGGGGFRRNPRAFLRGLIGQTLEGVQADLASDCGVLADEPVQLVLLFSENNQVSLLPSSDGESLRISRKEQAPFPSDEPGMQVVRKTRTEEPQWLPFLGKRCEDIIEVRDTCISSKGTWCGVEFVFEGGVVFTAYNWNDVLVTHAPPEDTGFLERSTVQRADEDGEDGRDKDRGRSRKGSDEGGEADGDAKADSKSDGDEKGRGRDRSRGRKRRDASDQSEGNEKADAKPEVDAQADSGPAPEGGAEAKGDAVKAPRPRRSRRRKPDAGDAGSSADAGSKASEKPAEAPTAGGDAS